MTQGIDVAIVVAVIHNAGTCAGCQEGGCYAGRHCPCEGCGCTPTGSGPVHWVGGSPTSLHGSGAASFERTTRNSTEVTCALCRTILARAEPNIPRPLVLDDGTLGLGCGSLWSGADYIAWREDHLPACAICVGTYGDSEPSDSGKES